MRGQAVFGRAEKAQVGGGEGLRMGRHGKCAGKAVFGRVREA